MVVSRPPRAPTKVGGHERNAANTGVGSLVPLDAARAVRTASGNSRYDVAFARFRITLNINEMWTSGRSGKQELEHYK